MVGPKTSFLQIFLVAAAATVLSRYALFELSDGALVDDPIGRRIMAVWTLLAMPFAFWMPRAPVRFFAPLARVPLQTYLLPQRLVLFLAPVLWGQSLATILLALTDRPAILWMSAVSVLVTMAFCAGVWSRLRRPAEFELPWWPTVATMRRCLRSFGWRVRR